MNELVKIEKPRLPEFWDYEESVKKVKSVIYKWGNITQELLGELWVAREKLSTRYHRDGASAPTWGGYCEEIGSTKSTINRWLQAFEAGWQNLLLSQNPEWFTPRKYIEAVREVLGEIDLDPASCGEANQTVRANKFYSQENDGLLYPWMGKVFLNPPYGTDGPPFVKKLNKEYENGNVTEAILLVNSRATDAEWFQPLYDGLICFTDHRIDFDSLEEKSTSSTHGSCFVYFGPNKKKFAEIFSQFGKVLKRYNE